MYKKHYNILSSNDMKSIKGGIIVEHVMNYDVNYTDSSEAEFSSEKESNSFDSEETNTQIDFVSENWNTEEE